MFQAAECSGLKASVQRARRRASLYKGVVVMLLVVVAVVVVAVIVFSLGFPP